MNDFVQEIVQEKSVPRIIGFCTGWETIVFQIEDDADVEPALQPVRAG
jgi:hypothetical protein